MLVLLILLVPAYALCQEPLLITPDDAAPLLDPSMLPALLPPSVERVLSYVTLLGAALVTLANLGNGILTRLRGAGRVPPVWLELVVGLLLDAGTDLAALKDRIAGRK